MLGQLEVADDLGPQEADDVARDREPEARDDLLGDGRAAEDVAPLEDQRLEPGARKVRGGDEPVVPAADDHRVVALRHATLQVSGRERLRVRRDGGGVPLFSLHSPHAVYRVARARSHRAGHGETAERRGSAVPWLGRISRRRS